MSNVGIKMVKVLSRLCLDENNLPKLCAVANQIRDNKISVSKVVNLCRTGTTKPEIKNIKVNGINAFTIRSDSNGTPTVSFRKELLEHVSLEDCMEQLVKFTKEKFK
jgi:hypothetical protein